MCHEAKHPLRYDHTWGTLFYILSVNDWTIKTVINNDKLWFKYDVIDKKYDNWYSSEEYLLSDRHFYTGVSDRLQSYFWYWLKLFSIYPWSMTFSDITSLYAAPRHIKVVAIRHWLFSGPRNVIGRATNESPLTFKCRCYNLLSSKRSKNWSALKYFKMININLDFP